MQIYGLTVETANTADDDLSSSNRTASQKLLPGSSAISGDCYTSSTATSESPLPDIDTVSLSHSSRSTLDPDVRSEKIAQLKASIGNGTYHVTATAVAGKIIAAAKASIG